MTTNILTTLVIKPEKLDYALDYLKKMKEDTQTNEPGVVFYQSYWYEDRPNEIIVVEIFKDDAAKEFHLDRHAWRREDFNEINAEPEVLRFGVVVLILVTTPTRVMPAKAGISGVARDLITVRAS